MLFISSGAADTVFVLVEPVGEEGAEGAGATEGPAGPEGVDVAEGPAGPTGPGAEVVVVAVELGPGEGPGDGACLLRLPIGAEEDPELNEFVVVDLVKIFSWYLIMSQ